MARRLRYERIVFVLLIIGILGVLPFVLQPTLTSNVVQQRERLPAQLNYDNQCLTQFGAFDINCTASRSSLEFKCTIYHDTDFEKMMNITIFEGDVEYGQYLRNASISPLFMRFQLENNSQYLIEMSAHQDNNCSNRYHIFNFSLDTSEFQ
jgi:hypothetical protein